MPGPAPKPRENLRRRNVPAQWIVLPAAGCKLKAPSWPLGKASTAEAALWRRLWGLPVAAWWHEQRVEPSIVSRYVRLALDKPALATVSGLERDLGLTPAGMARLRLVVEQAETPKPARANRYLHVKVVEA